MITSKETATSTIKLYEHAHNIKKERKVEINKTWEYGLKQKGQTPQSGQKTDIQLLSLWGKSRENRKNRTVTGLFPFFKQKDRKPKKKKMNSLEL